MKGKLIRKDEEFLTFYDMEKGELDERDIFEKTSENALKQYVDRMEKFGKSEFERKSNPKLTKEQSEELKALGYVF